MPILFLSTPSARRATSIISGFSHESVISIHALREEGDAEGALQWGAGWGISIHALREEGDRPFSPFHGLSSKFLSTPSARRATWGTYDEEQDDYNFYPRPPRGGRLLNI